MKQRIKQAVDMELDDMQGGNNNNSTSVAVY